MDITALKWKRRYLRLAREIRTWSKDPSKQIGAIIVNDSGRVISQGYNGFPADVQDDPALLNDKVKKRELMVHAEANTIYNVVGASAAGCTMFVSGLPVCHECAGLIIRAGIKKVIADKYIGDSTWAESCSTAVKMFADANVEYEFLVEDEI